VPVWGERERLAARDDFELREVADGCCRAVDADLNGAGLPDTVVEGARRDGSEILGLGERGPGRRDELEVIRAERVGGWEVFLDQGAQALPFERADLVGLPSVPATRHVIQSHAAVLRAASSMGSRIGWGGYAVRSPLCQPSIYRIGEETQVSAGAWRLGEHPPAAQRLTSVKM